MANEFVAKNGLISQKNSTVSGSLTVTQGITGSLFGTASWATNFVSASNYVLNSATSSFVLNSQTSSMLAPYLLSSQTSSFVTNDQTSSFVLNSQTSSMTVATASWAINAITSSRPIAVAGTTIYSTAPLSTNTPNTINGIFLGLNAGLSAINAINSNFLGLNAGNNAANAQNSNFIGTNAGQNATNAEYSNFIGPNAGNSATEASHSNFLGFNAGSSAINAINSNFLGLGAGNQSTNAAQSNFLGYQAGQQATNANNSNFLGYQTGKAPRSFNVNPSVFEDITTITSFDYDESSGLTVISATTQSIVVSGDYSTNTQPFTCSVFTITGPTYNISLNLDYYAAPIIDSITYNGGLDETTFNFVPDLLQQYNEVTEQYIGPGSNNIIIGTNITLEDNRQDSINIGGIIFGTGSHSDTSGEPATGSAGGKIGINIVNPNYNLEVSGTISFPSLTNESKDWVVTYDTASGQLFYTASSAIGGGGSPVNTSAFVTTASFNNYTGSSSSQFAGTASYATTASYALNGGGGGITYSEVQRLIAIGM